MPYHTRLADDLTEFDVVIAGGGLTGCVVAGRLAEADSNLKILLIEQGPNNYGDREVVHPALYPRNLFPNSRHMLFWQTRKSSHLADRAPIVPSGGTLGGGSAVNWMVYTRAQRSDFDAWKTPGWGADEMLPFLKKLETYHGKGDKDKHGFDGPIQVSKGTHVCSVAEDAFVDAATRLGHPEANDLQNLDANDKIERYYKYIGPTGRRQDAAHRYLHPKLQGSDYPNLHVLTEKQVVRVLFDGKRACGVEYQTNAKFLSNPEFLSTKYTALHRVTARKMVVVSTGANGTPGVLERSGVGNAKLLEKLGVPVVEDLPGVGEDYQDHHLSLWTYRSSLKPRDCINGFMDGRFNIDEAIRNNDELLGTNGMDAQGKFRPTEEEVDALGPEFRKKWDEAFKNYPDKPLMIVALYTAYYGDQSMLPQDGHEYVSQANWTGYPFSRGSIHITSPDMHAPVDFNTGWLEDDGNVDVKKHVWAYKITREMWRRMPIFRGELKSNHPKFPEGSEAAVVEKADGPIVTDDKSRIKYTEEDDKAIEQRIREIVSTTWHSLGTCKMAPKEEKGVVDGNLSVHGLEGLKLADLSVPPGNVGANTGNTAYVVGEKAADIIVKELGLHRVDSPQL